ncbi:class I SAM-dependent methyltransferase [Natronolimnohabitans innermongolicus]|uniref:Type 11 methyltransferase n=1 Tax=Natronolimnohabitans innermongolicus JCM 12255 TaxID=1227499 RepID=L9X8R4_9EURY|nr:class I SAM-dependent methyltransferase [Natronolimnohabitans innermongolicus]ELY57003.1 type 11 methyltransferase [Natronolimnohabitans innermongolicus JCM 12255]
MTDAEIPDIDTDTTEWDSDSYDGSHSFVYEYGADVLDLLDPEAGERILDLGCGTGHLTQQIAERGADVVGVDRSAAMLERARATYPEREFVRADARTLALVDSFDAVFSNAALHWIRDRDQDAALESIADALEPGGRLVAELGGTGNVDAIVAAVRAELAARGYAVDVPWYFPSVGEYASRLESCGFEVRYARLFDRPTELEDGENGLAAWLELFGEELFASVPEDEREAVVEAVEDRLREKLFDDGTWTADYRRLRVVAVIPSVNGSDETV